MLSSMILHFTLCMTAVMLVSFFRPVPFGWGLTAGVLLYIATAWLRLRFVYRARNRLQRFIENDNEQSKQRIESFRTQRGVTDKKLQEFCRCERQAQLRRILDKSDELNRFSRGHLLSNMQDLIFRHSLLWELQEWEKADRVLGKLWFVRTAVPELVAYLLARSYMQGIVRDDDEFKNVMWYRACIESPLPYAVQSWILVQKKEYGRALAVLTEACRNVKNETLEKNRDALARNRPDLFSNAGLGHKWTLMGLA